MRWGVSISATREAAKGPQESAPGRGRDPRPGARPRPGRLFPADRGMLRNPTIDAAHDRGPGASLAGPVARARRDRPARAGAVWDRAPGPLRDLGAARSPGSGGAPFSRLLRRLDDRLAQPRPESPPGTRHDPRSARGVRDGRPLV